MGREVVTGYCWPQSAGAGEQVGLHLSSSGGRPVRVEVARVGARREVVLTADARGGRRARHARRTRRRRGAAGPSPSRSTSTRRGGRATTRSSSRSTSARRCGATTRSSSCARRPARASCSRWRPTPGTPTTTSAGRTSTPAAPRSPCSDRWRRATCTSRRARAVASRGRARPTRRTPPTSATSSSTTCRATPDRRAGPTGSCRSSSGPSARASRSACARTPTSKHHPEVLDGASLYLSVGHDEYWSTRHARHRRGVHRRGRQRGLLLGQHLAVAGAHRGRRPRRDGRLQGLLQERPADGHRPGARGRRRSGPT